MILSNVVIKTAGNKRNLLVLYTVNAQATWQRRDVIFIVNISVTQQHYVKPNLQCIVTSVLIAFRRGENISTIKRAVGKLVNHC